MSEETTYHPEVKIKDWYFTFGYGHGHDNCYTIFKGTYSSAREKMLKAFGPKWGFQYGSAEGAGVNRYGLHYINKHGEPKDANS